MGNCAIAARKFGFWLTLIEMMLALAVSIVAMEAYVYLIPMWFPMLYFVFVILTLILFANILDEDPTYFHCLFLIVCMMLYIVGIGLLLISYFYEFYEFHPRIWPFTAFILSCVIIFIMFIHFLIKCFELYKKRKEREAEEELED